ncbi:MAG: PQQ-binding-like beta-propeller repeat protein [Planctomycetaceae bacterium]|nr:PQQ-binding-like beta-propeller repeat protein [Planctomycetaceae bacterium]
MAAYAQSVYPRIRPAFPAGICLAVLVFCLPAPTFAQLAVPAAVAVDDSDDEKSLGGFQVPVDDSVSTTFKDFERFAARNDWEKAFRAIGEIPSDKRVGMLKVGDGMIVPARQRIWQVVADLPAEGREAFRVFFDAKARELLSQIEDVDQAEGLKLARQIFDEYFLTSAGDDAANLLGEAAFEVGNFGEAEQYWRDILDHHPGSELSDVKLQVKRAVALLYGRRDRQFDALLKDIAQRFPGQTVVLGGEDVDPVRFLQSLQMSVLESSSHDGSEGAENEFVATGVLQEETPIAWQVQFLSDNGKKLFDQANNSNNWYQNGIETYVPPFTTRGHQLFCNWFGVVFSIDTTNGKLQWRSDKFDKLHSKFSQLPHSQCNIEQFAVVAGDDVVLAISLDPEKLNNYREPFQLMAYERDSGKQRWKSSDLSDFKQTSFVGEPLILGDNVLVTTHGQNDTKYVLRSLKLKDGGENWNKELGTAVRVQRSQRYQEQPPIPSFLKTDDAVYMLTNNGALIALDGQGKDLEWVLKFEGPPTSSNQNMFWYYNEPLADTVALHSQGAILEDEGTVYFKEAVSNELYAVDPSVPKVLWKRPLATEAVLTAVDDNQLFVLTREIMAIDRDTQRLQWARRLPIVGGGLSTVVGRDTVYVFTNRGIYCLDKQDGSQKAIFRGADLETNGGWIEVLDDRLVCVSNMTVTAYIPPWSKNGLPDNQPLSESNRQ